jgi:hypothetical protein
MSGLNVYAGNRYKMFNFISIPCSFYPVLKPEFYPDFTKVDIKIGNTNIDGLSIFGQSFTPVNSKHAKSQSE